MSLINQLTEKLLINIFNSNQMKNNLILYIIVLLGFQIAHAQQDPQFTQYTLNPLSVNSAYAGSRGHISIIGLHRSQWVGLDGAPRTTTISVDAPLKNRVGVGLSIVQDELGPSEETYTDANFSYTIPVSRNFKLAFGLKAGFRLLSLDFNKGTRVNSNDIAFQQGLNNEFFPTFGAGLFLHSKKKYFGVSIPNVLNDKQFADLSNLQAEERFHLFFIGGWVMDIAESVKFKPAFLVKHVQGTPLSVDVSANFLIQERFSLGVSYRWDDSVSGLAGFQISPNLLISYAYDFTTTDLEIANSGTHEISLRFDIFKDRILKSPRFF